MICVNLIRALPHYRRDAFDAGLKRAGYMLVTQGRPEGPQDLLVIWNRYGNYEQQANQWESHGGTVLVAENGYIEAESRQRYALAAHGHNGSGWIPAATPTDRFRILGVELQPWREAGDQVVVRGQRGIGPKAMASPPSWHSNVGVYLRDTLKRPVKVVPHPGNVDDRRGVEHLANAWALVIWSSAMGVYALTQGIPVWYAAPHWICEEGGRALAADRFLANPNRDDGARMRAFDRAAGAQWSVAEIESGEPFALYRDELAQRVAA